MTDEEKLKNTQDAFCAKIMSINTWADFETAISTITKTKVKNFIKLNLQKVEQNLQTMVQNQTDAATDLTNKAADIGALITEVDNI